MKSLMDKHEEGFTMLELMVVVFVIGVLSTISIPVFNAQKKKAIYGTVVSDVKHAGLEMQSEMLFANDPYSMLLPNFFVSQNENVLQINHMQSSADFFCIVGTNGTYEDIFVYYDSAQGGLLPEGETCGETGDSVSTQPEEQPTEPANASGTPVASEPVSSTPPATGVQDNSQTNEPQPGDKTYIPPAVKEDMAKPVPNSMCEARIREHINAYTALYGSLKYQNLVSVMARLQSGNKDMADILKNTAEGKRAIAASRAIESDKTCSNYVSMKTTTTSYYFDDYAKLTEEYLYFMNNLTEDSADTEAYVKAYKKLYSKVYGVSV